MIGSREETAARMRAEFERLRAEDPDLLDLNSQRVREEQVRKTEARIRAVQQLRNESLARSYEFVVG